MPITATPDPGVHIVRVSDAGDPLLCPRCGKVVPRTRVTDGEGIALCDNRSLRGGSCGQHLFILTDSDVTAVSPISREHYQALDSILKRRGQMNRAIHRHLLRDP